MPKGMAPPPAPSDLASPCPADPSGSTSCLPKVRDEQKGAWAYPASCRSGQQVSNRTGENVWKNLAGRRLAHVQAGRFTEIFSAELPRFRWRGRLLSLYICA